MTFNCAAQDILGPTCNGPKKGAAYLGQEFDPFSKNLDMHILFR